MEGARASCPVVFLCVLCVLRGESSSHRLRAHQGHAVTQQLALVAHFARRQPHFPPALRLAHQPAQQVRVQAVALGQAARLAPGRQLARTGQVRLQAGLRQLVADPAQVTALR